MTSANGPQLLVPSNRRATAFLLAWSITMLVICYASGSMHDYVGYLDQWRLLLSGSDPWSTSNAYGPLHTVLGYLLPSGELVPKFAIVCSLLLANGLLFLEGLRYRGSDASPVLYLSTIALNVLVVGMGAVYGLNDGLVALLLTCAVISRHNERYIAAGVFIGLAGLTKFYPLLLLPFFGLSNRKPDCSLMGSGVLVFISGMAAAYFAWGASVFSPILLGADRGPKLLSIFAAIQSVFGDNAFTHSLMKANALIVVASVTAAFIVCVRNNVSWIESAVVGYLTMLTSYKVGHQQFYIPLMFLVFASWVYNKRRSDSFAQAYIPLAVFLSIYQMGYFYNHFGLDTPLAWVRLYGGLFAFPLALWSIYYSIRTVRAESRSE